MTTVFIIQNHDQTYLTKQGEWVDGSDASALFRTSYKDEAINMKVEQSVRNPMLRLTVLDARVNAKGQLELDGAATGGPNIDSATEVLFNTDDDAAEISEATLTSPAGDTTI